MFLMQSPRCVAGVSIATSWWQSFSATGACRVLALLDEGELLSPGDLPKFTLNAAQRGALALCASLKDERALSESSEDDATSSSGSSGGTGGFI